MGEFIGKLNEKFPKRPKRKGNLSSSDSDYQESLNETFGSIMNDKKHKDSDQSYEDEFEESSSSEHLQSETKRDSPTESKGFNSSYSYDDYDDEYSSDNWNY